MIGVGLDRAVGADVPELLISDGSGSVKVCVKDVLEKGVRMGCVVEGLGGCSYK